MQARNHDGTYGEPIPYSEIGMSKLIKQKKVSHVEVFEGTPENIAFSKKAIPKNR